MQTVNVIAVGKLKEKYLKEACMEYAKRLKTMCKLTIIEVEEARNIQLEAKNILEKIPSGTHIISLCIEGQAYSSIGLAHEISDLGVKGKSNISFIIGGSQGIDDTIKVLSHKKLSMSKMTFPHQLARVMLLEQIYRAFSINTNKKYHK